MIQAIAEVALKSVNARRSVESFRNCICNVTGLVLLQKRKGDLCRADGPDWKQVPRLRIAIDEANRNASLGITDFFLIGMNGLRLRFYAFEGLVGFAVFVGQVEGGVVLFGGAFAVSLTLQQLA
jgi:hypothetical protein